MTRTVPNPNTGDQPIEITRAEVARVAKTGCKACHGAGVVVFAQKHERGQLVAVGRPGICRCVAKHYTGRADIREFDGKMHWMPKDGRIVCGFRWGEGMRCALEVHPPEFDHADKSGARMAHPKMAPKGAVPPLPADSVVEGAAP